MISFQVESWADYSKDCLDLWASHYDEIERKMLGQPLKPDNAMYAGLDAAGRLFILTARRDGAMVGYIVFIVCPHPHCTDLLCAYEEHYFLHQSARGGKNGLNLIRKSLDLLRERGVNRAFISTPPGVKNQGRLLKHIGFEHSGDVHSISLGVS